MRIVFFKTFSFVLTKTQSEFDLFKTQEFRVYLFDCDCVIEKETVASRFAHSI